MSETGWSSIVVPYGADQTVYVVIDRFLALRSVVRETEVERTCLETIIGDLMSGQFNDPVRVVAFNTLELGRRTSRPPSLPKFKLAATSMASRYPSM